MKQRGRESLTKLATVTQLPSRMLEAPDELTTAQAAVWRGVVATKPADWFDAGSMPLLAAYCRVVVESERLSQLVDAMSTEWLKDDEGLCRYKELRKLQSMAAADVVRLARQMRLSQQSRYDTQKAATANRKGGGSRPWVVED